MEIEVLSIYYDDNKNLFIDDFGVIEYDISDIMPYDVMLCYMRVGGTYYANNITPGVVYEIEFPIRDISRSLYYDEENNVMLDEDSEIVFNIFSIITPNDYLIFKKRKESMLIPGVLGGNIELIYPIDEEDFLDIQEKANYNASFGNGENFSWREKLYHLYADQT